MLRTADRCFSTANQYSPSPVLQPAPMPMRRAARCPHPRTFFFPLLLKARKQCWVIANPRPVVSNLPLLTPFHPCPHSDLVPSSCPSYPPAHLTNTATCPAHATSHHTPSWLPAATLPQASPAEGGGGDAGLATTGMSLFHPHQPSALALPHLSIYPCRFPSHSTSHSNMSEKPPPSHVIQAIGSRASLNH